MKNFGDANFDHVMLIEPIVSILFQEHLLNNMSMYWFTVSVLHVTVKYDNQSFFFFAKL